MAGVLYTGSSLGDLLPPWHAYPNSQLGELHSINMVLSMKLGSKLLL